MRTMWLAAAVFNAAPTWKMNTAPGSPCASSVMVPVSENATLVRWTPPKNVCPFWSPAKLSFSSRPAALLYAAVRSVCAWAAAESPACVVPPTVPGGKPRIELLGLEPRSPLRLVAPVLMTPVPASTE